MKFPNLSPGCFRRRLKSPVIIICCTQHIQFLSCSCSLEVSEHQQLTSPERYLNQSSNLESCMHSRIVQHQDEIDGFRCIKASFRFAFNDRQCKHIITQLLNFWANVYLFIKKHSSTIISILNANHVDSWQCPGEKLLIYVHVFSRQVCHFYCSFYTFYYRIHFIMLNLSVTFSIVHAKNILFHAELSLTLFNRCIMNCNDK